MVLKVGREEPVASMDSSGKVIWAKHNEVSGRDPTSTTGGLRARGSCALSAPR